MPYPSKHSQSYIDSIVRAVEALEPNEPVIFFRGNDPTVPDLMRAWSDANLTQKPADQLRVVLNFIDVIERWKGERDVHERIEHDEDF